MSETINLEVIKLIEIVNITVTETGDCDVINLNVADGAETVNLTISEVGRKGDPGDNGKGSDLGWQVLSDDAHNEASPQEISAGVRTLLLFNGLGGGPDFRDGSFSSHDFIDGNRFRSLAIGDTYELRLTMKVKSYVINNEFDIELDIGGTVNRIQGTSPKIPKSAGVTGTIEVLFKVYALDTFLANGAGFYLTPISDLDVWEASLFVEPGYHP